MSKYGSKLTVYRRTVKFVIVVVAVSTLGYRVLDACGLYPYKGGSECR